MLLCTFSWSQTTMALGPLKITSLSPDAPEGFSRVFEKQVSVFGISVFATAETPDETVLHTANVLAQYLDNDEDGVPDNPAVVAAMLGNNAAMIMAATERDLWERDPEAFIPV